MMYELQQTTGREKKEQFWNWRYTAVEMRKNGLDTPGPETRKYNTYLGPNVGQNQHG
jgi:hypothetical protein